MINLRLLILSTGFRRVYGLSEQGNKLDVAHVVVLMLNLGRATREHIPEAVGVFRVL